MENTEMLFEFHQVQTFIDKFVIYIRNTDKANVFHKGHTGQKGSLSITVLLGFVYAFMSVLIIYHCI